MWLAKTIIGKQRKPYLMTIKVREDLNFEARFPMNLSPRVLASKMPFHRFDNVAAALQDFTEEVVVEWVNKAIKQRPV